MLDIKIIQEAVERAVAAAHAPSRVILFGSYARGDADEGSDVDLMIIERQLGNKGDEMVNLDRAIGWIGKGVDVLVYSEEDFARRCVVPGTAPYWAAMEGKVMYDASH
jgi:predicted nucleotidyltransferase